MLDVKQQQELIQYVLKYKQSSNPGNISNSIPTCTPPICPAARLTELHAENLYFCLENRSVYVCDTEVMLTVKEFDIFALLIMNPHRVFTYDMIIDFVWHENLDYYSRRAINNHVSNLRRKLKLTPETPDYIINVHSIGYKFNSNIEFY